MEIRTEQIIPPEKNNSENSFKALFRSEGLLIFIAPILAYIVFYYYFKGYFYYFNIPENLLSLETIQIIGLIAILLPNLFNFSRLFFISFEALSEVKSKSIGEKIFFAFMFVFLLAGSVLIFFFDWILFGIYFGILLIIIIILYIRVRFLKKQLTNKIKQFSDDPKITAKLEGNAKLALKNNVGDSANIKSSWMSSVGSNAIVIFIFYVVLTACIYSYGTLKASKEISFQVAHINPECVILYMTSERAICYSFDRTTKIINNSFKIIPLGNDPNLEFTTEKIGPLKRR